MAEVVEHAEEEHEVERARTLMPAESRFLDKRVGFFRRRHAEA
jgi:hypothetical protein